MKTRFFIGICPLTIPRRQIFKALTSKRGFGFVKSMDSCPLTNQGFEIKALKI